MGEIRESATCLLALRERSKWRWPYYTLRSAVSEDAWKTCQPEVRDLLLAIKKLPVTDCLSASPHTAV